MPSGSRKKKANKRKKANKPNLGVTFSNPSSDDNHELGKFCNGGNGVEDKKLINKGSTAISKSTHAPHNQIPSDGDEAEEDHDLVVSSPPQDLVYVPEAEEGDNLVDSSPPQAVVSLPQPVGINGIYCNICPPGIEPLENDHSSVVEVTSNISSSHTSEINISYQPEDVPSTKSTVDLTPRLGFLYAPDSLSSGSNTKTEAYVTNPFETTEIESNCRTAEVSSIDFHEPETEGIYSSSELEINNDSPEAHKQLEISNNGCFYTPSSSLTVSDFIAPEEIKEIDYTSIPHLRNLIESYAMVFKSGHDHGPTPLTPHFKINSEYNCCIGEVISEQENEEDTTCTKLASIIYHPGLNPVEISGDENDEHIHDQIPNEYPQNDENNTFGSTCTGLSKLVEVPGQVSVHQSPPFVEDEETIASSTKYLSRGEIENDEEKSPSTSSSTLLVTETARHDGGDGAVEFAECQSLAEPADLKIEKVSWKSCCGLFSLPMR